MSPSHNSTLLYVTEPFPPLPPSPGESRNPQPFEADNQGYTRVVMTVSSLAYTSRTELSTTIVRLRDWRAVPPGDTMFQSRSLPYSVSFPSVINKVSLRWKDNLKKRDVQEGMRLLWSLWITNVSLATSYQISVYSWSLANTLNPARGRVFTSLPLNWRLALMA
jgi:hypothetical protein